MLQDIGSSVFHSACLYRLFLLIPKVQILFGIYEEYGPIGKEILTSNPCGLASEKYIFP